MIVFERFGVLVRGYIVAITREGKFLRLRARVNCRGAVGYRTRDWVSGWQGREERKRKRETAENQCSSIHRALLILEYIRWCYREAAGRFIMRTLSSLTCERTAYGLGNGINPTWMVGGV